MEAGDDAVVDFHACVVGPLFHVAHWTVVEFFLPVWMVDDDEALSLICLCDCVLAVG